jgi:hypothetical protein
MCQPCCSVTKLVTLPVAATYAAGEEDPQMTLTRLPRVGLELTP